MGRKATGLHETAEPPADRKITTGGFLFFSNLLNKLFHPLILKISYKSFETTKNGKQRM